MKKDMILVTGGAGFIGSFLVDALIKEGYSVRILDNLEDQVHLGKAPSYLNKKAEFIKGDIRDPQTLQKALQGVHIIFHLASRVGVGQSNYQIKDYVDTNIGGTAVMIDLIVNNKMPIKKIVMTASMTSYGEGDYVCKTHGIVRPFLREDKQMAKMDYELYCPTCKKRVKPISTKERTQFNNNSIYALTKNVQEEMLLLLGKMYNIPVTVLRCFNVYGPRQSISNPYTGVSAIFISRLKNGKAPVIYEDGMQTRDFVSVRDVVDALIKAMESKKANFQVINIGSGIPTPIKEIAEVLAKHLHKKISPKILNTFRKNDIRHCFADISKAKKLLRWSPKVSLPQGLKELVAWSEKETSVDMFEQAEKELRKKKLL